MKNKFVLTTILLVLAALITPPDVVTQFLIGIPLYVLYELSILVCMRVTRNAEKEVGTEVEKVNK